MIWLLSRVVVWPTKVAAFTGGLATRATARTAVGSAKLGYRTGRLVGYRRIVLALVGVAVGLLLAPVPGRELRDRLWQRLASGEPTPVPPPPGLAATNGSGGDPLSPAEPYGDVPAVEPPGETGSNPAP